MHSYRTPLLTLCLSALLAPACVAQPPLQPNADVEELSQHEGRMVRSVRAQLVAEQFDDIDRLADQLRREKSRWPGGVWKLHTFYKALDKPCLTDKDTVDHLNHLKLWMSKRPESITPRIALATSLHRWAWSARGSGTADKVSEEGWRLFNERIAEAQVILTSSQPLALDPQWYKEEMTVGLAEGWDASRMADLYRRAVQFEPLYPGFYTARANYLLPKWYGEAADATNFARTAADHVGGDQGDLLYFVIATAILHRGNGNLDHFVKAMDWPRIQRGYQALATMYGVSPGNVNQLAFMAYKFKDSSVAQQQFALIGPDWAHGVWKDQNFFNKVRDWSTGHESWP